jgi:hypothetical protein
MYHGWTPNERRTTNVRQDLNEIHATLTELTAQAYEHDRDVYAFKVLSAANKVAEAEAILSQLSQEARAPVQFTEDTPAAYKTNRVHTP